MPVTNEEKAQLKLDNEQGLVLTREQIKQLHEGLAMLKDSDVQMKKLADDQSKECPPANRDLIKKHMKEFAVSFGITEK